jgi:hypothetical protein
MRHAESHNGKIIGVPRKSVLGHRMVGGKQLTRDMGDGDKQLKRVGE